MLCPKCNFDNPDHALYCSTCGARVGETKALRERLTAAMPQELASKILKARLGVEGERKLVSVLFADVVGSTTLAERIDIEEWVNIMNEAFDFMVKAIYRYEGIVLRLLGDAVLAFFGAPVAHEDDAERALRAAMEIQQEVARYGARIMQRHHFDFKMRVGLNTGEAIVSVVGADLHVEYTAMGDTVNLASRLQNAARAGSILMAESTYRLVRHLIEAEPRGELVIRGHEQPIKAYEFIRLRAQPHSAHGIEGLTAPLIGRAAELKQLQERFDQLAHTGRGAFINVLGEAGVGKTRLIAEARKSDVLRTWRVTHALHPAGQARDEGQVTCFARDEGNAPGNDITPSPVTRHPSPLFWLEGHCYSYPHARLYGPWRDVLRRDAQIDESDSAEQAWRKLASRLSALMPEGGDDVLPYLARLLQIAIPAEYVQRIHYLDAEALQRQVFAAVRDWAEALARRQPTILYFEDMQWASENSLALLEAVLPLTATAPLMILCAFRPERTHGSSRLRESAAQKLPDHYAEIQLKPLSADESAALIGHLLADGIPDELYRRIVERAEGNPYFIEEVIRALIEDKRLVRIGNRWRATRELAMLDMPDSLQGVLAARIDRLPAQAKTILQVASVIGRVAELDILSGVLQAEPKNIPAARNAHWLMPYIAQWQAADLVDFEAAQRRIVFKSGLLAEAAYNALLQNTRRQYHAKVAQVMEQMRASHPRITAGMIGLHYAEAQQPGKAIRYLSEAGDIAERQYANREAIDYYRRALQLLEAQAERDLARTAHVLTQLAGIYARLGEFELMGDYDHRALSLWHQIDNPIKVAHVYFELAYANEDPDETIRLLEQGLAALRRTPVGADASTPMLARGYRLMGEAMYNAKGKVAEAVDWLSKAITLSEQINLYEEIGASHKQLGLLYRHRGDSAPAAEHTKQAIDMYLRAGRLPDAAQAHNNLAVIYLSCGELRSAHAHVKAGLQLAEQTGAALPQGYLLTTLGELHIYAGEWEQAQQVLRRALILANRIDNHWLKAECYRDLGLMAMGQREFDQAQVFFTQALLLVQAMRANRVPQFTLDLAEAHTELGQFFEALRLIDEAIAAAKQLQQQIVIAAAQRLRGKIFAVQADYPQAIAQFQESLAAVHELNDQLEVAHTLYEYGSMLLKRNAAGDREASRALLDKALENYQALNARMGIDKVRALRQKML